MADDTKSDDLKSDHVDAVAVTDEVAVIDEVSVADVAVDDVKVADEKAPRAEKAPRTETVAKTDRKADRKAGRKSDKKADKTATAPVVDRQSAGDELRELGGEELVARLLEAKAELFNLRFQLATGQMDNNRRVRTVRHDIARIYTVMRERELGLSVGPDGVAGQEGAA